MAIESISDAEFEDKVLKSDKPVVVDFWAPWCGPCKMIAPALEELAAERQDVRFVKINIDDNPETPTRFGVRGIPTLIVFKDGQPAATKVGALPKQQIASWLTDALL